MRKRSKRENGAETLIWFVYSLHFICMTVIAMRLEWNPWIPAVFVGAFVLGSSSYLTNYGTLSQRAYLETMLIVSCHVIYSFNVTDMTQVLPMFLSVVVLTGLFGTPGLVYITMGSSIVIFFYHFVLQNEFMLADHEKQIYMVFQLINVLVIEITVWIYTKRLQEKEVRIQEIIDENAEVQKTKDDFLANISHEIRTPVNTICGMSELALQDSDMKSIREKLWDIRSAGRNLTSVVSNVLDFSELQSDLVEINEESYSITSTINDVINVITAKIEGKKLELIVNLDPNLPSLLLGDEKKIRRVILSFVDNAIKFTKKGGICLAITGRREEYGVNLSVSVRDTGIGMEGEEIDRLFTDFGQLHSGRNRMAEGMGLGLSIARAIINKMGGNINVTSVPDKGSEFSFVVAQKILDDKPIVEIEKSYDINAALYFNMEQFETLEVRDEYINLINTLSTQLDIRAHMCMNIQEMKRRYDREHFTHVFIGFSEYQMDSEFFDRISDKCSVNVVIDNSEEKYIKTASIHKIYKPFYILPIVSILNNGKKIEGDEELSNPKTGKFKAPDARVLIVDDNQMNIRVVEGLMAQYGMNLVSALSGKEALKLLDTMNYDLVFMDHMMPEMDGVECLHHIREKGSEYYKNLPIVALTANAIAGTREMFLHEGFNDFVEKPVEPSVLERALKRNLPKEKLIYEEHSPIAPQSIVKKVRDSSFSLGDLDVSKGILYCGGEEKYIDILKMYLKDSDKQRRTLTETFEKENWKDYTIIVHAIKSSMFSIGAVKLSEMAKALEAAGKQSDTAYICDHHYEMIKEYNRVMKLLDDKFGAELDEKEGVDLDSLRDITTPELRELADKFENAAFVLDKAQMTFILNDLEECKYQGVALYDAIDEIMHKVEMSDYLSAAEALHRIVEASHE